MQPNPGPTCQGLAGRPVAHPRWEDEVGVRSGSVTSLVALVACHNRRDLTVRCLQSLFAAVPSGVTLTAVLADDGSTDGTAEAVAGLDLPVEVIAGDGTWFWSRSMAKAEAVAERSDPDWVLWLNDDTVIHPAALLQWLVAARERPDSILVGGFQSSRSKKFTYSGFDWPNRSSLFEMVVRPPDGTLQRAAGFHGNFVAVPRSARRRIGPIDDSWPHNYADVDYALRAGNVGVDIWVLPRTVGTCDPTTPPWKDQNTSPLTRLRSITGHKYLPVRAHWRLHRRHGTGAWLLWAWKPHWKALVGSKHDDRAPAPSDNDTAEQHKPVPPDKLHNRHSP
jgi:GT2 family glycosyltransferase